MRIANIIVRSLLGTMFVVFGLNIFFHFIPIPPPPEGPARDFMRALTVSRYFYVIGALEFFGGLLLLTGRFVPLGLTFLGPVIVNILCVHIFLERSGLAIPLAVSSLALFLLWQVKDNFAGLCKDSRSTHFTTDHSVSTEVAARTPQ